MGVLTSERRAVARSVAAVQAMNSAPTIVADELERPFTERVIAPLGGRLVGIGRKITRADTAAKIAHRLDIAGNPPAWDVNRIIGLKVLGLGVVGVLGFVFCLSQDYTLDRLADLHGRLRRLRLRAAQPPAEERRRQARETHAQRAP